MIGYRSIIGNRRLITKKYRKSLLVVSGGSIIKENIEWRR